MSDIVSFIDSIRQFLRSTNIEYNINYPEIIVVGEQSSGKSSILESLIGIDILPKSTDIVTKRPIVIKLIQNNDSLEYAVFDHIPEFKFTNFNEVLKEILRFNQLLSANSVKFSEDAVNLKIYSNRFLNMTLIDLPGLTQIPVNGQPDDIAFSIQKLVSKYLMNLNAIYLAVIPAIIDVVNSEALKLIKVFDPQLKRTIGVLTKIDLMDSGTNCTKILLNKVVNLALGWIGVINRSFNDLKSHKSFEDSIQTEKFFFLKHPIYRRLSNKCGTIYLKKKIYKIFISQIEQLIPVLQIDIKTRIDQCEEKLKLIEPFETDLNDLDETNKIIIAVREFCRKMNEDMGTSNISVRVDSLSNGVIIEKTLLKFPEMCNNLFPKNLDLEIQMGIENATGLPGYVEAPDAVIRSLVRANIEIIRCVTVNFIQSLYVKMVESINYCCVSNSAYSNLNQCILNKSLGHISEAENKFQKIIQFFIDCERDHVNFHHPDFISCYRINNDLRASSKSLRSEGNYYIERVQAEIQNKNQKGYNRNVVLSLDGYTLWINTNDAACNLIGTIALKGCAIKSFDKGSKISGFSISHKKNKYVVNQIKRLHLKFETEEIMKTFKEKILEIANTQSTNFNSESRIDMMFKVDRIKTLVEKYTNIVVKNIHDLIIKYCHFLLVQGLDKYIHNELIHNILHENNLKELLQIDCEQDNNRNILKQEIRKLIEFNDYIEKRPSTLSNKFI